MSDEIKGVPFPTSAFAFEMTLLKAQRNHVFMAVESVGLDPKQFTWEVVPSSFHTRSDVGVSKLLHSSGYHFVFNSTREGVLFYSMSRGTNGRIESGETGSWSKQLEATTRWLTLLKEEIEATDLWETIKDEKALIEAAAAETDNSPLTVEEQQRVRHSVEEIKQFLLDQTRITDQQTAFVSSQLAYLIESADRLGRKDWSMLALSSLVTITVALSLTPESARQLFRLAGQVLGWLLRQRLYFPLS